MTYNVKLIKFFFAMDDNLIRVKKAETVKGLWWKGLLLILLSMGIYLWMAVLGVGTSYISEDAVALGSLGYEVGKLWFIIGRIGFAVLFAFLILFIPSIIFNLITKIEYRKLIIMQQVVLAVMLVERLMWIPLAVYAGLDWFTSPLSFGIIASYAFDIPWVIFFFGAISAFQLWIIWFQVNFLTYLSPVRKGWVWAGVVLMHMLFWAGTATIASMDQHFISGWFA
ncbi:hypothetical protein [Lentibacillus cibarius]|uniref:Yip1 domain-containing protein n=1 Tax=Lentibacillus cibarius TaxID=2583219 RepID=A0A5S3R7S1_9BACI|nr:hypothetical protein [Lentibacillus cibarius]TMN22413.1 hypothetical protein FFL34_09965 [Lentibacillus cibarius]